ncbi:MAG: amidohydrolase family protein [Dehalococcoidia bacterium]
MTKYSVISADSHVVEEPDLFVQRIDASFRDRAPHMVREADRDVYYTEGLPPTGVGLLGAAGRKPEELGSLNRFEQNRRGGYDPEARFQDMERDGVDAEVLYPTIGFRLFRLSDLELQAACFRAYNDWLADMCSGHEARLKGLGMVSLADIETGVGELRRAKELGLAGSMIAIYPEETRPYSDPYYEPFWATSEELGMPVSLHILTAANRPPFETFTVDYASMANWAQRSLAALIFSGVFQRHPGLKVVCAEADIGWIANFLQRIDHTVRKHGPRLGLHLERMPGEYFRENVRATFMTDMAGMRTWDLIGEECIMWSNDYPHTDSTWPNSQQVIAREFEGVPEEARRKILAENCAELYGFD